MYIFKLEPFFPPKAKFKTPLTTYGVGRTQTWAFKGSRMSSENLAVQASQERENERACAHVCTHTFVLDRAVLGIFLDTLRTSSVMRWDGPAIFALCLCEWL